MTTNTPRNRTTRSFRETCVFAFTEGRRVCTNNFLLQCALVLLVYFHIRKLYSEVFHEGFLKFFKSLAFLQRINSKWIDIFHDPYFSFSISLKALTHPLFFISALILALPLFYKPLKWEQFDNYQAAKTLVLGCCGLLVWNYSFYEYNYYLDRPHHFDRLFLIFLWILSFRFPEAVGVLVAFSFLICSQFSFPLGFGDSFTDKGIAFDIPILFFVFAILKRFFSQYRLSHFLFLALILHCSNYFYSGLEKVLISPHGWEWLVENELVMHFRNKLLQGWLTFLTPEMAKTAISFVQKTSFFILLFALFLELAAIFVFLNYKVALVLLALFDLLHLGIFFESGIFFWKWIIINLIFIFLLPSFRERNLFGRKALFQATVLMALIGILGNPIRLGWFDVKYFEKFLIKARGAKDRETFALSPLNFAPYNMLFTFQRFYFITDTPVLGIASGTASYEIFRATQNPSMTVEDLTKKYGKRLYNRERSEKFDLILKQFAKNVLEERKSVFWSLFKAPYHIFTMDRKDLTQALSPSHFEIILEKVQLHNDEPVSETQLVRTVPLPQMNTKASGLR